MLNYYYAASFVPFVTYLSVPLTKYLITLSYPRTILIHARKRGARSEERDEKFQRWPKTIISRNVGTCESLLLLSLSLSLCHFCIGQQRLPARNNSTAVVLTVYTKRRVTTTRRKSVRDTRRSSPTPSQVSEIVIPAAAAVQQFPLSLSSVCVVWRVRERKYYARPLQRSFRWKWRRCLVHTIRGHGYFSLRPFPFRSRSVERKREGEENCDELRVTSLSMRACVCVGSRIDGYTCATSCLSPPCAECR